MKSRDNGFRLLVQSLSWITMGALFVGLIIMEKVNYTTTHESLQAMFGATEWVMFLSIAVVLLDIATLVRVLTPETDVRKEPIAIQILLLIWAGVNVFDASLNWFYAQLEMEQHTVQAPAAIAGMVWVFPVVTAFLIWGLQVGLLYFFAKMLEMAMKKAGLQVQGLDLLGSLGGANTQRFGSTPKKPQPQKSKPQGVGGRPNSAASPFAAPRPNVPGWPEARYKDPNFVPLHKPGGNNRQDLDY